MNIFNDFELLDFSNLDVMMWGEEGGNAVQVPCAHLTVSAYVPYIALPQKTQIDAPGHLTVSVYAPSCKESAVHIPVAHLTLADYAPTYDFNSDHRYWVGGDGTFSDTAHWAFWSGGPGGASAPTTGMYAHFDLLSKPGSALINIGMSSAVQCYFIINNIKLNVALSSSWYLAGTITGLYGLTVNTGGKFYSAGYDVYCSNFIDASGTGELYLNAYLEIGGFGWSSGDTHLSMGSSSGGAIRYSTIEFHARGANPYLTNLSGVAYCTFGSLDIKLYDNELSWNVTNSILDSVFVSGDGTVDFDSGLTCNSGATILQLTGDTVGGLTLTGDSTWTVTKASGIVMARNCAVSNSSATGGATFIARTSRGNADGGGNSGWDFTAYNKYWIGNTGDWSDTAHWSASSGGSGGAAVPIESDGVCFDANSITGTNKTINLDIGAGSPGYYVYPSLDFSNVSYSPTLKLPPIDLNTGTLKVNGDFILKTGMALTYNCADGCTLMPTGPGRINMAGNSLNGTFWIGNYAKGIVLESNITCWEFYGNSSYDTHVDFGGHTITLDAQGTDAILNFKTPATWEGAPDIVYDINGIDAYGILSHTGIANDALGDISFSGTPTTFYYQMNIFKDLIIGTLTLPAPVSNYQFYIDGLESGVTPPMVTLDGLVVSGTAAKQIVLRPYSAPSPTLSKASGSVELAYCTLQDLTVAGGAAWIARASRGCIDSGGNTGWYFGAGAFVPTKSLAMATHVPKWSHTNAHISCTEITVTPYEPTFVEGAFVAVPCAHLVLDAHAAAWGEVSRSVPPASLTITAHAPDLQYSNSVPITHLVLTALETSWGIHAVTVSNASLILTPRAPYMTPTIVQDIPSAHLVLTARATAWGEVSCSVPQTSLELSGHQPYQSWSLSKNRLATLQNIYLCVLTGVDDGVADLIIPISSFQSTMRDGDPSYLACVVPNSIDFVAAIAARPNGDIVIRKGYKFSDGTTQTEEICRVDYESLQISRGAHSDSAILSGHKTITSTDPKSVTLANTSFYGLQADGKKTFRADPDLFLRVGDTAVYGAESIIVEQISYMVSDRQAVMQITEA
jgi:hypothetical protein